MQPDRLYVINNISKTKNNILNILSGMIDLRAKLNVELEKNKKSARKIYNDINFSLKTLTALLSDLYLYLIEAGELSVADYTKKLINSLKTFNVMTPDYSKLKSATDNLASILPCSGNVNAAVVGRLMNRIKMGYYPTDLEHMEHIKRSISFPEGVRVNLFDPCCGKGDAIETLALGNYCFTYGIELDNGRAEEAAAKLDRVGFGSYFYSRVSNESFHTMLLNPPYLSVLSEHGENFRSEKRFLVESFTRLMMGGLLIYIIPYYRLTEDICRVICDNFKKISIWKFYGDEFKKFSQIAVMGIRKKRQTTDKSRENTTKLASYMYNVEKIPELRQIPNELYSLSEKEKNVSVFRGSRFNVAELSEQLSKSKSFSKVFEKNKIDSMEKRPLLPLSIGQIGLIGGSGFINGLVECDTPHIIKGRIIKETKIRSDMNADAGSEDVKTIYETNVNKMIFNILTPKGFLSLS